jgi:hypothetical protein
MKWEDNNNNNTNNYYIDRKERASRFLDLTHLNQDRIQGQISEHCYEHLAFIEIGIYPEQLSNSREDQCSLE